MVGAVAWPRRAGAESIGVGDSRPKSEHSMRSPGFAGQLQSALASCWVLDLARLFWPMKSAGQEHLGRGSPSRLQDTKRRSL